MREGEKRYIFILILIFSTAITQSCFNNKIQIGILDNKITTQVSPISPSIVYINRKIGSTDPTYGTEVIFQVEFTQNVTGVEVDDFILVTTGNATGAVSMVTAINNSAYEVIINTISGIGTLQLNLNDTEPMIQNENDITISSNTYIGDELFNIVDTPPNSLSYTTSNPTYAKYTAIADNSPASGGGIVISYSISPSLPSGITLDTSTGIISGIILKSDPTGTDYTITATNSGGSTQTTINIIITIPNFTWIGSIANSDWTTGTNWQGGSTPSSSDIAIFDDDCGVNCDATINANIDIKGLQMKSSYTGTITQSSGNTITIDTENSDDPGILEQAGGTFIGSDAAIIANFFRLTGGTFTSTSGDLKVGYDANYYNGANGFIYRSPAVFNHNSGVLYIDIDLSGNFSGRQSFEMVIDQPITFYDFEYDLASDTIYTLDGTYNSHYMNIKGLSEEINVLNSMTFHNGFSTGGDINFYGTNVHFACDTPVASNLCSSPIKSLNNNGYEDVTQLIFTGSSAQTYSFDDGAGAPGFQIDNASGVSTVSTGTIRVPLLDINSGDFTAPPGILSLGGGTNTNHINGSNDTFNIDATGGYLHNNGTLSIDYSTSYNDNKTAAGFISETGNITFYNLIIDITGDYQNKLTNNYKVELPNDITVVVENSFIIENGYLNSGWASAALIDIRGTYERHCSDIVNNVCAAPDYWVHKRFGTGATSINMEAGATNDCNRCIIKVDIGFGQTIDLNSDWSHSNVDDSNNLNIISGILNLSSGVQMFIGDDFINDANVTCSGGAYITVTDIISGIPGASDNSACYGP